MVNDSVTVQTASGKVRGRWQSSTSSAFLGIPFAKPPVGKLRFQAPQVLGPWEGTLDALEYGATAQRGDPGVTLIPEPSIPGKSTLNVNVFTPQPGNPEAKLPVLVWIHGGGYFAGSPASPWYNGRNFNRDGVVTVTASYRLGFDGFGAIEGAPSNRGVRDWLAALEWVQQNIANFGGDPHNVTISGQSAGGGAVLTLLGMPAAQHLFTNVYALSSPIPDVSAQTAKQFAERMATELGVEANLAGFSSVSEEELLRVQKKLTNMDPAQMEKVLANGLSLGPTVDGELIPQHAFDSIRSGIGADKPLVAGVTDDEFTMALEDAKGNLKWVPTGLLLKKLGVPKSARKDYLRANAELTRSKFRLAGRVITDRMFKVPLLRLLDTRSGTPTWAYRFAWPSGKFGYAEHCLDVPFFFDYLNGPNIEPLAGANPPQQLADELHADVVRFLDDGDPGWPRYELPARIVRVFDVPVTDVKDGLASAMPLVHG